MIGTPNFRPAWHAQFYASCLGRVQDVAREHGYAACLHGSMTRDLDLVMVPWTEKASDAETLIAAMRETFSIFGEHPPSENARPKPHGRMCWTVLLGGHAYMDISVMPRVLPGTLSMVLPPEIPGEDPPLPDYDS